MADHPYNTDFSSSEELLKFIKERSDDIDRVSIPTGDITFTDAQGRPAGKKKPGMILHLMSGMRLISREDAEILLNDGLLNRMKIRIEIMKDV